MSEGRRPRVYIPNRGVHDYSQATKFGDLVFITEGSYSKYALTAYYRLCIEAMEGALPTDYLMVASLSGLCAVAAAILARKFGVVNLLLYKKGDYVERKLDIDSLLGKV